jgi:hypothetical protein
VSIVLATRADEDQPPPLTVPCVSIAPLAFVSTRACM